MKVSRRTFLKIASAAGTATVMSGPRRAQATLLAPAAGDTVGLLIDTTRCLGCRACEVACSKANNLPAPEPGAVFNKKRTTSENAFTVVNRYADSKGNGSTCVKTQCMHCNEPACVSVCPAAAMEKTPQGPVVYHRDRCIGCRYCMMACPFGVPKYEYDKAVPYVRKCILCFERLKEGKLPACAAACPGKAIQFGKRRELLETAKTRIYQNPDKYVHHIYGEREAGGTGVMYLSAVPFEEIGFSTNVGTTPYTQLTSTSLSAVPFILTLAPAFLLALHTFSKRGQEGGHSDDNGGRQEKRHEE